MLGGLNGQNNTNGFSLDKIVGMMSALGSLGGVKTGGQNPQGGLDLMKLLPLLTAMKGNPLASMMKSNNEDESAQDVAQTPPQPASPTPPEKPKSYKDKYEAISFAGNEVIYTLGKLWKVNK